MDQRRTRWARRAKVGLVVAIGAWAMGVMQAQQALLGRPTPAGAWAALGALGLLGAWLRPGPEEPNDMLAGKRPAVRSSVLWIVSAAVTLGGMLALLGGSWVVPPPGAASLPENWLALVGAWAMFAFLGRQVLGWLTLPVSRVGLSVASWLAWGGLVTSVALTVASAQGWRQRAHSYTETLGLVGTLTPSDRHEQRLPQSINLNSERMSLEQRCDGDRCSYSVEEPGKASRASFETLPDETTDVFVDTSRGLLVLHTAHEDLIRSRSFERPTSGLRLREVQRGLAVPLFWLASAVVGQAAALVMLARTRRWRRLLVALRAAREGTAHEGHVVLEGEGDLRLPAALRGLPSGSRVTVLASEQREGYRADLASGDVLAGTVVLHRQRVSRRLRDHVMMAGALGLLLSTPLVAAWALGVH